MHKHSNLGFALDFWAARHSKKIAVHADGRSLSYGELNEKASRLAGMLQTFGLSAQDSVLIFMPNCIEYLIVFFAAVKLNLHIAPANALSKNSELFQLIQKVQPKLAFVKNTIDIDLLQSVNETLPVIHASLENESFCEKLRTKEYVSDFPRNLEGASIYVSTSGSTGKLKFVSTTYQNELINANLYLQRLCVSKEDILMTSLPVSQKFGMAAMLGSCCAGCTLVLPSRFDAKKMLSLIETHRVTVQYGVPTMYIKEQEAYVAAASKPDISSLRTGIIAGAAGSTDTFRWFEAVAGCRLLNCYGTTEIGGLTMVEYNSSCQERYSSCGRIFDGARIEIVDKNGQPLPCGKYGEIVCSVPWGMDEYVGEPELTAQMFDSQNRFLTGDIGKLDEAGNLIISGRKKDMIIRGGYNIFPAEVELALLKHPDISEASVIGYRDQYLGERICAFVKTKEGVPKEPEDLRAQLEQHIAKYKLPDRIMFVDEIPRLANGKNNYPAMSALLQKHCCPPITPNKQTT